MLACAAAIAGAALGWVAVRAALSLLSRVLPSWVDFGVDLHFFRFALAISAAVVLLSGLAPAFELSKTDAGPALAGGGLVIKAFYRVVSVTPVSNRKVR